MVSFFPQTLIQLDIFSKEDTAWNESSHMGFPKVPGSVLQCG